MKFRTRKVHQREYNKRLEFGNNLDWRLPAQQEYYLLQFNNITVIQDAFLACGMKSRFVVGSLMTLSSDVESVYYGGSPYGHVNLALAQAARWLEPTGKKLMITCVIDEYYRKNPPPFLRLAEDLGARVVYTNDIQGFLLEKAKDLKTYIYRGTPEFAHQVTELTKLIAQKHGIFDEFWYTPGTGATGLAIREAGIAIRYVGVVVNLAKPPVLSGFDIIDSGLNIDDVPRRINMPPYTSASNFDAKVWKPLSTYAKAHPTKRFLVWNMF